MTQVERFETNHNVMTTVDYRLIEGGKGSDNNWLSKLDVGSVFVAQPTPNTSWPAYSWLVVFQGKRATKLRSRDFPTPQGEWVNSAKFSKAFDLLEVLLQPIEMMEETPVKETFPDEDKHV